MQHKICIIKNLVDSAILLSNKIYPVDRPIITKEYSISQQLPNWFYKKMYKNRN